MAKKIIEKRDTETNSKLQVSSIIIITSLLCAVVGYIGGRIYLSPEEREAIEEELNPTIPTFTPLIDGIINSSEHWELAENMHTTFLNVDEDHTETYNYLYADRQNDSLLIALDLCSDTVDDAENNEWISIWLDTDNSKNIWNYTIFQDLFEYADEGNVSEQLDYELSMNYIFNMLASFYNLDEQNGTELLVFNLTSGEHNVTFSSEYDFPPMPFNSTCDYEIEYSFGNSSNFAIPHRMFEINITLSSLANITETSDYGMFVMGYGTMAFPMLNESAFETFEFYTLPNQISGAYWNSWIAWHSAVIEANYNESVLDYNWFNSLTKLLVLLTLPTIEEFYFPMGVDIYDLNSV